ncbi:hypothetical protein [Nocardia sp. NPDC052566]|uniref:hypothetical protein n=1 Tax=Nocardia sp. NPDC052566 TaxID=3364330 RepID=UPI0037C797DC
MPSARTRLARTRRWHEKPWTLRADGSLDDESIERINNIAPAIVAIVHGEGGPAEFERLIHGMTGTHLCGLAIAIATLARPDVDAFEGSPLATLLQADRNRRGPYRRRVVASSKPRHA